MTVAPSAGAIAAHVYPPGDSAPSLSISAYAGPPPFPLSWEAEVPGRHVIVLEATLPGYEAERLHVAVQERQPPDLRARMREALRSDARVQSLRDHALVLNSISPNDTDYSDLEPLRETLRDVRLVLLGESNHGNGSDFLARSRLVRFLHQELDFSVLAFESGLYDMQVAWMALLEGAPADEAFALGAFGVWARAEQMQPLISYVARAAHTDHPLELAGFDMQFSGVPGERFGSDLQHFLDAHGIGGPLADPQSPERARLTGLASNRFCSIERSELPEWTGLLSELDAAADAAAAAAAPARTGPFWQRVIDNAAICIRDNFGEPLSRAPHVAPDLIRDWIMADNLVWLANAYYSGRRIIAWGHSGHFVRNLGRMTEWAWSDYTMGDDVYDALGEKSFVIGTTTFAGQYDIVSPVIPAFDIVADQHPLPEFEELMDAAGIEYGFVDLRGAAAEGTWLGGHFPARPSGLTPSALWHEHFDALLFIRNQEGRRERSD